MLEKIKNKYNIHKKIIFNLFWRFLQVAGRHGVIFLIMVLCAKYLGPKDFGFYSYITAIIYLLSIFGDFGISTATSKYVAEYSLTDKNKSRLVLFNSFLVILVLGLFGGLLFVIFGKYFFSESYDYLLYILPLIIFISLTSLLDGVYRGLKRFKELSIISVISGVGAICLAFPLISNYGIFGALISQNILYASLVLFLLIRYGKFKIKFNKIIAKEVSSYGFIVGIGSISLLLYGKADIMFLGNAGFFLEVGYYEIIDKILMILLVPFYVLAQVIAPDITKHYANNNINIILEKMKKYLLISLAGSLLVVISVVFLKNIFLNMFFQEYNTNTMHIFLVLMLPMFFTQILNSLIPIGFVNATGHAKLNAYVLIIFGIIHIVLNVIFLDIFGAIGIIYSLVLAKCTSDIIYIYIYYKIIKNKKII